MTKEIEPTGPRAITESDNVQDEWYAEAKTQTEATLPEFVRHVMHDYVHDYGTICHATAACAIAAAHAVNHGDQGGISGFQAGAIMWEFIDHWGAYGPGPKRLVRYADMLYPQYKGQFRNISKETWRWLQAEAARLIKEAEEKTNGINPKVWLHWNSVAAGVVPFGMKVEED